MDYEYDVFLSYSRDDVWKPFIDVFCSLFEDWLKIELGGKVKIFRDIVIESGVAWPEKLGNALSRSRVLVPLLSTMYFNSEWCVIELAHMRVREKKCGFSSIGCPEGLIIPAYIHDGDDFPEDIRRIQAVHLQKYTNIRMRVGSKREERLSELIRDWVPHIKKAIKRAPPYDPSWQCITTDEFVLQFKKKPKKQEKPEL